MFLQRYAERNEDLWNLLEHDEHTASSIILKLTKELFNCSTSEICCYQLLNHPKWKDILFGIFQLLNNPNCSVSGNAAFIIGALCKYDAARSRVFHLILEEDNDVTKDVLISFNKLLSQEQPECVINAVGVIATVADSAAGRIWLLKKFELNDTINLVSRLIPVKNVEISSNASLFIARLTVDEEGCARILNTPNSRAIIIQLIEGLMSENSVCTMNSAFALGQLFQLESCQRCLLSLKQVDQMIQHLIDMVISANTHCQKNSCYALQCLSSVDVGCDRLLNHRSIDSLLYGLLDLLRNDELALLSVFFMQSIVLHKKGCLYLRDHPLLKKKLKDILQSNILAESLETDVLGILEYLEDLPTPVAPDAKVESATSASISWKNFQHKNGFRTTFHLFQDQVEIYRGYEVTFFTKDLKPAKSYTFYVQYSSEGQYSAFSALVKIKTPESVPSAPTNFHVDQKTTSQIKVAWERPMESNGVISGYVLSLMHDRQRKDIELSETNHLFTNLQSNSKYHFEVCGCTRQGAGPPATLITSTNDLSCYAPSRPVLRVRGRTEIFVSWDVPKTSLGRLNYYELQMNDQIIYNGTERSFIARALLPGKKYTFKVSAWTSEGRCESGPTTRRTPRLYGNKETEKNHQY